MKGKSRLKNFPISFFAVILGLLGFTLTHKKAVELLHLKVDISDYLIYFLLIVFLILIVTYLLKLLKFNREVKKEIDHPIRINFFPTIGISFLLLSILLYQEHFQMARIFWLIGIFSQTYFSLLIITRWMHRSTFKIENFNPSSSP